jgi:hypothetical protein
MKTKVGRHREDTACVLETLLCSGGAQRGICHPFESICGLASSTSGEMFHTWVNHMDSMGFGMLVCSGRTPQMDPNVPYTSLKTSLVIGNKWKNICSAHGSTQENGLSFDRFHLGLGGCQVRFVRFDSLDSFDLKETWIQWIIQWIIWSYTWLRVVIQGCMILP